MTRYSTQNYVLKIPRKTREALKPDSLLLGTPTFTMMQYKKYKSEIHSTLTFLEEKGGKYFAGPDYF